MTDFPAAQDESSNEITTGPPRWLVSAGQCQYRVLRRL